MPETDPDKISELEARLESLVRTQIDFQVEISAIRKELTRLRNLTPGYVKGTVPPPPLRPDRSPIRLGEQEVPQQTPTAEGLPREPREGSPPNFGAKYTDRPRETSSVSATTDRVSNYFSSYTESAQANLEKFIGENLISKIGIVVLVLGVGIGVKYAIDNNLISPLTRVVLGYLFGLGLIGLAAKLRPKYNNFSAVLFSGGVAILYVITYFAYAVYDLIGQPPAFALMVFCTIFTVAAALFYDRQIIAHYGLVGGYAVPFLLSNNSGNYTFLFAYMAILNAGILAISLKKRWKPIFYTASIFTWFIFTSWFVTKYSAELHFNIALIFGSVFFAIFYATKIVHGTIHTDGNSAENSISTITTSLVFYGFGYAIFESGENTEQYQGLLTVGHGVLHLLVALTISRVKPLADVFVATLAVLVIVFATIAIPVQFDGHVITLIWAVEAAALFAIGRAKAISLFEYFSYPVMLLAGFRLLTDWVDVYDDRTFSTHELVRLPFANAEFVTGLIFVAAFAIIFFVNKKESYKPAIGPNLTGPFGYLVAAATLFVFYNVFRMEIGNYFYLLAMRFVSQFALDSTVYARGYAHDDFGHFNTLAQINYTMLFLTVLAIANFRTVRSKVASVANILLAVFSLVITATVGMYVLYELRVSYINADTVSLFGTALTNVAARFVTYLFTTLLLLALYEYCRNDLLDEWSTREFRLMAFEAVVYPLVLIFTSCELINFAAHVKVVDADKFGLSILWGMFALAVIVNGIAKARKHLRIGAIVLLAVTLAKLFFYDISELGTIPKTILFVSLGMLLLVVSFLYNKYKNVIFGTDETDTN